MGEASCRRRVAASEGRHDPDQYQSRHHRWRPLQDLAGVGR
jgi:hypothetical protein